MIRRAHPVRPGLRRRLHPRLRGSRDEAVVEEAEEVAAFVRRLAVLLGAGLHLERAWSQLAPPGGRARRGERAVPALVRRVAAGAGSAPLADRVVAAATAVEAAGGGTARSWSALAAGLEVADRTGAPLARSLDRLADSLVDIVRVRRDAGTALAGPVATSRTVLLMPGAGLLLAAGLGFDPLRVLVTTVPGLVCLVVGSSLVAIGWRWNRRLVSRALPREPAPGLVLDLVAMAMSGGASVPRAVAVVRRACERAGLRAGDDLDAVGSVVDAAARTGAPVAVLLGSEAERIRRDAATWAERAAARLAARLMLPLGVCILPAFLAVGVVPMLLAVVSSTLGRG
ncbi:type II secretion system F family protein [Clavibacter michiganensis]|uniref:type II secretion system F family protein n=3 Tax=Clavibacter michiganensis TaxID=28447 RepID=UPI000A3A8FC6|nr:type II secretion system F family protein [Clavibacter michiganensis]MDO4031877.1 type II secretion system F family protein [Clavibacter michiganensis]MDO4082044.1 type II secretion system F family protein [Clavibacter michiganensis]MDO4088776.1 type II secretion system F family protein [Clavibacter michiganensis]MDO4096813.1 type II secretion system F family protein [Clavibacter michiganensis]MWJ04256.1 pilus assembly protein [Clavibacter michiganensis subsp. michiganensis]